MPEPKELELISAKAATDGEEQKGCATEKKAGIDIVKEGEEEELEVEDHVASMDVEETAQEVKKEPDPSESEKRKNSGPRCDR